MFSGVRGGKSKTLAASGGLLRAKVTSLQGTRNCLLTPLGYRGLMARAYYRVVVTDSTFLVNGS